MTARDPEFTERFELFLDGLLVDEDRERVQAEVESDEYLSAQAKLQSRIDDAAKSLFAPPEDLNIVLPDSSDEIRVRNSGLDGAGVTKSRWSYVAMIAIAASIAWIAVALNLFRPDSRRDIFNAVDLTKVYATCVDEGFEPYWVCDDDAVFAGTFLRRQGVALELADMPDGSEMVGLSYLAGISRKSTGMLTTVADRQVIVFVDRRDRDWKPPTGFFKDANLNVFRMEKYGLVFYEVTPFDEMRVAPFFQRSDEAPKVTNEGRQQR